MESDAGSIVTVDGRIDPAELGLTMPHEHIFTDLSVTSSKIDYESPVNARRAKEPLSLENRWFANQGGGFHLAEDQLFLDSLTDAIEEVSKYYQMGGDSIVDVTPANFGRDPTAVRAVMRETGVNIVHGTAYYTQASHPPEVADMGIDEVRQVFVDEVRNGIGSSNVRAGIIGELGVSGEIREDEEKVLRGGARAALDTGASVTVHPNGKSHRREGTYPSSRWGLEILDILEEEGLPAERVVIDHMDRAFFEGTGLEYQKELAERGAFIEYDEWGMEGHFMVDWIDRSYSRPSNLHRAEWITELVNDGYASNLLFSHDRHQKPQLAKYGGRGYFHIINDVVPLLLGDEPGREFGITSEDIEQILVGNPKRMLTFAEPEP
jgi:phosphotriesterase-related protein